MQGQKIQALQSSNKKTLIAASVIGVAATATAYYLGANPEILKPVTTFVLTTIPAFVNSYFNQANPSKP
jgi:hypothetical protein